MGRNSRRIRHLIAMIAAYAVALQVLLSGVVVVSATADASLHVLCVDATRNTGAPPPHSGCCPGCFACAAVGCGFAAAPARVGVALGLPVPSKGTPLALANECPDIVSLPAGRPYARAPPSV